MPRIWQTFASVARTFWSGLRQWCGDADYERYANLLRRRTSANAVSRKQFYLEQLNRRYSRPNRCC
ncbi:MAG TPA: CstA-like transporter-associated (seleno)protein [Candidatus Acidoferrales bacterium]|nr:CstA-like transporter-associated (seleno)protein [Candidatus Acidoferrales bacterium]